MESEKKIYIRGNKQYSNLINAYFKKLGIKKLINDDYYTGTNYIYYITHDDLVACANEEYEIACIIKDNYKEITIDENVENSEIVYQLGTLDSFQFTLTNIKLTKIK